MPWSQISPGHWQREIGENELFIKMIGDPGHALGYEHWSINADATFTSTAPAVLVQHLENAWKNLRFEHPSIAAIAGDTRIDYVVPDVAALEKWSSETFVLHRVTTKAEIAASQKPTPYAMLHVFPESSEVLLYTSHWRTDGVGVVQLLNAFFELAGSGTLADPSRLPWGQETSRLAPSVEEAAGMPPKPNAKIHAEADGWTKTFEKLQGAVGINCSAEKTALPGGTRSVRTTYSEDTTQAIVKACKTHDISVTSAVHAALASTNWTFAHPDDQDKHYTSTIRAALRPYLPAAYQTPALAAGLYTSGYMHSLPAGKMFIDNARELNTLYRLGLSHDYLDAHRQYALNLQDVIRKIPADAPPPSDVDISSIGKVDKLINAHHGALEVTSIAIGVQLLTRQMVCFVWTFRNKLAMNLVYNEAFYDAQTAANLLENLKDSLTKGLGIAM